MKKSKTINVLGFITMFVLIFFVATTVFDLTITYVAYLKFQDNFILYELNPLVNWGLNKGIPYWYNPVVYLTFFLITLYAQSYLKLKEKKVGWTITYTALTCILIIYSAFHLLGGGSWLYSGDLI